MEILDPFTVAVVGMSGTGKTKLVNKFVQLHNDWKHAKAGELILNQVHNLDYDNLRLLPPAQLSENQYLLANAFKEWCKTSGAEKVLFDGHAAVDSPQGLFLIPSSVFAWLGVRRMVFVESDPSTIVTQRVQDQSRIRVQQTEDQVRADQKRYAAHALDVAADLSVPFHQISSDDFAGLERAVLADT